MSMRNIKRAKSDFLYYGLKPLVLNNFEFFLQIYFPSMVPVILDIKSSLKHNLLREKTGQAYNLPDQITVSATNICNARCVFCAYRKLNYAKGIMPFEIYKKALKAAKNAGIKKLMFSPTVGEVLVDKSFFDKIAYAKKAGFEVHMYTNGILLTHDDFYKKIIDSRVNSVVVSIGDVVPKFESHIFGIPLKAAEKKIKGTLDLIKYEAQRSAKIDILLAFRSQRPFRKIWKSMKHTGFYPLFKKKMFKVALLIGFDNWCGNILQKELLGVMKLKRLPKVKLYPCNRLRTINILPDGAVRLCGCRIRDTEHDELVVGNVNNKGFSFHKVASGKRLKLILDSFSKKKIPLVCTDCSEYHPDDMR